MYIIAICVRVKSLKLYFCDGLVYCIRLCDQVYRLFILQLIIIFFLTYALFFVSCVLLCSIYIYIIKICIACARISVY